jgi:hypothetical protein
MRCKLIKEYAQLMRDDPSIVFVIEGGNLDLLLNAVLEWDVETLKNNIEEYKKELGEKND